MKKPLSEEQVRDLLKPLGNVGKAYYIDSQGRKHYVDSLPAVGGFQNKGDRRIYVEGIPDVIAYKGKEGG